MASSSTGTVRIADTTSRRRQEATSSSPSAADFTSPAGGRGGSGNVAVYPVVSTVAIAASTAVFSGSTTWALSVAKLTVARTPGIRFNFFSIRAAHEAQVMPPIRRSTACVMRAHLLGVSSMLSWFGDSRGDRARWSAGKPIAGLVDRLPDRFGWQRVVADHGDQRDLPRSQIDLHLSDPVEAGDLLGDRGHAMTAGHADDLVAGRAVQLVLRNGSVLVGVCRRSERTNRPIASEASRSLT